VLEDGPAAVPDLILGVAYLDHEEGDEGVGLDVVQRERFAALAAPFGEQLEDQGQILQALGVLVGFVIFSCPDPSPSNSIDPDHKRTLSHLWHYLTKPPKHTYIGL
jgi:hypothetical protein